MATMGRWTADTAGVGRRSAIAVAVATLATAPLFTPGIAHAQKVSVDSGVSTELSYTSNGNLGLTGEPARSDTVLDVRPHISIRTQGSRFRVGGSASLQAITSANGTQPSRILPEGQLD